MSSHEIHLILLRNALNEMITQSEEMHHISDSANQGFWRHCIVRLITNATGKHKRSWRFWATTHFAQSKFIASWFQSNCVIDTYLFWLMCLHVLAFAPEEVIECAGTFIWHTMAIKSIRTIGQNATIIANALRRLSKAKCTKADPRRSKHTVCTHTQHVCA